MAFLPHIPHIDNRRRVAYIKTYHPIYQAVLNYAEENSKPIPDNPQLTLDNQIAIGIENNGWALMDTFQKFRGTADPEFKKICWKRLLSLTEYGSGTWSETGFKGNGTNAYLNSHFTPSVDGVNWTTTNAGITYFGNNSPLGGSIVSAYDGSTSTYVYYNPRAGADNGFFWLNSGQTRAHNNVGRVGLNGIYRHVNQSEDELITAKGNGEFSFGEAAGGLNSRELYILGRNNQGTADNFSPEGIGYMMFGASLINEFPALENILV